MSAEILWFVFIAFLALFSVMQLKLIGNDERLVIFDLDKPSRVRGPGLVVVWPKLETYEIINISSRSLPLPAVTLGAVSRFSVVSGKFEFYVFDPLKAATTDNAQAATEREMHSALYSILSNATINQCLTERSMLERTILEHVNGKTRVFGAKVPSVTLSDFPLCRQLIGQLAGMAGLAALGIAATIQKVAEPNDIAGMVQKLTERDDIAMVHQVAKQDVTDDALILDENGAAIEHQSDYKFGINA
jgi:hypothetical protein